MARQVKNLTRVCEGAVVPGLAQRVQDLEEPPLHLHPQPENVQMPWVRP